MPLPISIVPSDQRIEYLSTYMEKKGGHLCSSYAEISDSGYVICGVPFTKDGIFLNTSLKPPLHLDSFLGMLNSSHILIGGNLPGEVIAFCTEHTIKYYDVLSSQDLVKKNARLTAEGLLIPLLSQTTCSICDFRTLITGYGNCGREIADILRLFTDNIYIYDTSPDAIKAARSKKFNVVSLEEIQDRHHPVHQINTLVHTAPANPFDDAVWQTFSESCTIFQVSSVPLQLPAPLSDNLIACPGIPGKYAPKTAGILIAREICRHFHLSL